MMAFWRRKPKLVIRGATVDRPMVFLASKYGSLYVTQATPTESGWTAHFSGSSYLLCEDGRVIGSSAIKGWYPHTGWGKPDGVHE